MDGLHLGDDLVRFTRWKDPLVAEWRVSGHLPSSVCVGGRWPFKRPVLKGRVGGVVYVSDRLGS